MSSSKNAFLMGVQGEIEGKITKSKQVLFSIQKNLTAVRHTCCMRLQLLLSWWFVFREDAPLAKCGTPSAAAVITASPRKAAKPVCWWNSFSWLRIKRFWLGCSIWGFPCLFTWKTTAELWASFTKLNDSSIDSRMGWGTVWGIHP